MESRTQRREAFRAQPLSSTEKGKERHVNTLGSAAPVAANMSLNPWEEGWALELDEGPGGELDEVWIGTIVDDCNQAWSEEGGAARSKGRPDVQRAWSTGVEPAAGALSRGRVYHPSDRPGLRTFFHASGEKQETVFVQNSTLPFDTNSRHGAVFAESYTPDFGERVCRAWEKKQSRVKALVEFDVSMRLAGYGEAAAEEYLTGSTFEDMRRLRDEHRGLLQSRSEAVDSSG